MATIVPKSPFVISGVVFVLTITLAGIFAPLLAPHDPTEISMLDARLAPGENLTYPLGTDLVGRDMLSRIIFSFRFIVILGGLGLLVGTGASLLIVSLRSTNGATSGAKQLRHGGLLDYSLLRLAGLTLLVGPFLMLVGLTILGNGLVNLALVACPFLSLLPVSLIYQSAGHILSSVANREQPLSAGVASGSSPVRLALRQGLALSPVTYSLAFLMGMFLETPVSYLGLGIPRGDPSYGVMISVGRSVLTSVWWMSLTPLAVVAISAGALMAIVLPIRRVQKQIGAFVQYEPVTMNHAGLWVRMASITVDGLILLGSVGAIGAISGALIDSTILLSALGLGLCLVLSFVYLGGYKDSVGHRLFKIKVVRSDGATVGIGRALMRGLFILILSGVGVVAIMAMLFSHRRQTLYDMLTNTVVVKKEHPIFVPNMVGGCSPGAS